MKAFDSIFKFSKIIKRFSVFYRIYKSYRNLTFLYHKTKTPNPTIKTTPKPILKTCQYKLSASTFSAFNVGMLICLFRNSTKFSSPSK